MKDTFEVFKNTYQTLIGNSPNEWTDEEIHQDYIDYKESHDDESAEDFIIDGMGHYSSMTHDKWLCIVDDRNVIETYHAEAESEKRKRTPCFMLMVQTTGDPVEICLDYAELKRMTSALERIYPHLIKI